MSRLKHRPVALTARPSVTVVVPCHNYADYLPSAVASSLDHEGLDIEVIVIDDASTDHSAEVATALAASDPRIKVVLHTENKGHIATYNEGLFAARGEYVVLFSADDILAPNGLTRALALMEAHPNVGFCYGYSPYFDDRPPAPKERIRSWTVWAGNTWVRECTRRGRNLVSTPEVVMRAAAFRETGGYEPALPHSADLYMWLRLAARWDVGRVNGPDQAFYRVHGTNMHLTMFAGVLTDLRERRKTFSRFFALDGPVLHDRDAVAALANRALSREAVRLAIDALDTRPADVALASAFAQEAVLSDPAIVDTRAWTVYRRLRTTAAPDGQLELRRRARQLQRSLEWKIRWRRWRWAGL